MKSKSAIFFPKHNRCENAKKWLNLQLEDFKDKPIVVSIKKHKEGKTWPQIKAFHGTVINQVQEFWRSTGEEKTKVWVKEWLKSQFLYQAKFYEDGEPVMGKRNGKEEQIWYTPSLADLSKSEMNTLITSIINYFKSEHAFDIVIKHPQTDKEIKRVAKSQDEAADLFFVSGNPVVLESNGITKTAYSLIEAIEFFQ